MGHTTHSIRPGMVYVKKLELRGFRSYREKTTIEFDKSYNVIVGLNGSGKSNILLALQFICESSDFAVRDASKILHEGNGKACMNAQVDLVVGNREDESRPDIVFSRRMSVRKDEFLIDFKIVKKSEFTTRLQLLGFSTVASPYYIIKQGRVMELACQSDYQRLKLIEGVAGIGEYEAKRKTAVKDLTDIESKSEHVDRLIQEVKTKLDKMKIEQQQFDVYNQLKSRILFIEDLIYKSESDSWTKKIDKIESQIQTKIEEISGSHNNLELLQKELVATNEALSSLEANIQTIDRDEHQQRQLLEMKQAELLSTKEKLKIISGAKGDREKDEAKYLNLEKSLEKSVNQYKLISEEIDTIRLERDSKSVDLHNINLEKHELNSRSPDDVECRLKELTEALQVVETEIASVQIQIQNLENELKENQQTQQELNANVQSSEQSLLELKDELKIIDDNHDSLQDTKKGKMTELHTINQKIYDSERKLQDIIGINRSGGPDDHQGMPVGISVAYQNISRDATTHNYNEDVIGPLIEHIKIKTISGIQPHLAVEVAAEGQWHNLLVKNSATAKKCAAAVGNGGYCTITPLEDISRRNRYIDKLAPPGTLLLSEFLEYDPVIEPAVKQVFRNWLLVDDLEGAVSFKDWNCVTVDGTVLDKSGVIGGGSYSKHGNILLNWEKKRERNNNIQSINYELDSYRECKRILEDEIAQCDQNVWLLSNKKTAIESERDVIYNKLSEYKRLLKNASERKINVTSALQRFQVESKKLNGKITIWRKEFLKSSSNQSDDELAVRLDQLKLGQSLVERELENLDKKLSKLEAQKDEVNETIRSINEKLDDHTIKNNSSTNNNAATTESEIKILLDYVKIYTEQYESFKSRCHDAIEKKKSLTDYKKTLAATTHEIDSKIHKISSDVRNIQSEIETLGLKCQTYKTQISKLPMNSKINRNTISENHDIQNMSLTDLRSELFRCRTELNNFSDMNASTYDRVKSYTKELSTILERRESLNKANTSIKDLIRHLDDQRVSVLISTFESVNKHFSELINKLSSCRGKLTLIESRNQEENDVSEYMGIGLKVSFLNHGSNSFKMNQLSGGQRTMVAVCLIFAIQRTETAPMYILDEIDAALDDRYRELVADIILESCSNSQFIMTTFRRQLAERGKRFLGVSMNHKISSLKYLTADQALNILSESETEKENHALTN